MTKLRQLVHEVHRRSLWQVVGIYLGGSWVAFQVVKELVETAVMPEWVPNFALVLLVIGFPIVLATAFVQEGLGSEAAAPGPSGEGASRAPEPGAEAPEKAGAGGGARREGPSSREAGAAAPSEPTPGPTLLTWRNALLGGAAAFVLLGLVMAGWLVTRALGVGPAATLVAQGVLDEEATVVLADFAPAGDGLARAATEAFRVDLSQSRVVRLAEPDRLRAALGRMARDPTAPLDRETAVELAVREGLPAVIAGEIHPAGGGHVLSAELVSASDREILVSQRVSAEDSTAILEAIDRLSEKLRERIGESIGRMRSEPALSQVTTSNLAALRKFSQATHAVYTAGDIVRGRALLEEAVALDTAFATALAALGTSLANLGEERALQVEAFERAYRHRDRLTEPERYTLLALYHTIVKDEADRAVAAYESLLEIEPDEIRALANLSDLYLKLRDYERAEELSRRAIALDSTHGVPYWNAVEAQARLGRGEEALATIGAFLRHVPDNAFAQDMDAQLRASLGDHAAAEATFRRILREQRSEPFWQATASVDLAAVSAVRGEVGEAMAHLEEAARVNEGRDLVPEALRNAAWASFLESRVRGDRRAAVARLDGALDRHPLAELNPLDRPYAELAEAYAAAGEPGTARRLMEELEAVTPEDVLVGGRYPQFKLSLESPDRARGEIARAEGRHEEAIEAFRRSDEAYCRLCALPGLARAYEAAGRLDSARAVYERYIELPGPFRLWTGDALYRGPVLERLGELYDEAGDLEKAARYYAELTELWAEADEELRPRVAAARSRLEEILEARG